MPTDFENSLAMTEIVRPIQAWWKQVNIGVVGGGGTDSTDRFFK